MEQIIRLNKKQMNEFELKQLYREINSGQRKLKDEEVDMLMSMFWDKFGNAMFGMALNPLFLLDDEENPLNSLSFTLSSEEEEKINQWNEKDIEHDFDEIEVNIPELDIKLLCGTPNKCKPYKFNGQPCPCIRENFESPTAFREWRKLMIKRLGEKIKGLIPLH